MHKKATLFTSLIIIFSLANSCNFRNDNIPTIHINPHDANEEIDLSEIAEDIEYIILETSPICLIGRIHSVIIRNKFIYILDISKHVVFVFDKNGNYISKLDKRGKGPGEYSRLGPVVIDENEEFVELITYSSTGFNIMKYKNISFEFLEETNLISISANSCRKNDGYYYFETQQNENIINNEITNAGIIITKNGSFEKTLFDKRVITHGSGFSPNLESFTSNDLGELFISIMYDNSFYKLSNGEAQPMLKLDFRKHSIDNSIGLKSLQEQIQYLETAQGLAYFPILKMNNSDLIIISYIFNQNNAKWWLDESFMHHYISFPENGKFIHTKRIKNDIKDFPEYIFAGKEYRGIGHEVWHNNYLVDIVVPSFYLQNKNQHIIINGETEVAPNDNPIIVLMKRKE